MLSAKRRLFIYNDKLLDETSTLDENLMRIAINVAHQARVVTDVKSTKKTLKTNTHDSTLHSMSCSIIRCSSKILYLLLLLFFFTFTVCTIQHIAFLENS